MIRSALLLCAGIIIAACFACVPAPPAPPPPVAPMGASAAGPACAFNNIKMLKPTFDPTGATRTPEVDPNATVPPYIQADLVNAFNLAPPFFQRQLCGLTGIYITPTGDSFGYRKIGEGSTYLGLAMSLWNGAPAPSFSEYENRVVHRLLNGWEGPTHPPKGSDPSDQGAVTVLAALAHEYGHILFYLTFVKPYNNPPDYTTKSFCGGKFFAQSWAPFTSTPIPWREYGQPANQHEPDDVSTAVIQLLSPPAPGDPYDVGDMLDDIYSLTGTQTAVGRWASLFASFSPDEDFVETFKLFVLKNSRAPLNSLEIRIPVRGGGSKSQNIAATCRRRPVLAAKLGCFAQAICGASPTTDACSPIPNCSAR